MLCGIVFARAPAGGVSQGGCAGAVDEHGGEGDESGAAGAVGGGWRAGERGGAVADVVGEHCACEPCAVRAVVPGGDVFESRAFFEIADGELDAGVAAVEPVRGGGVVFGVGDECVVSPVGPQPLLCGVGEAGAAHDEAHGALVGAAAGGVGRFGDLGVAVFRCSRCRPMRCRGSLGSLREQRIRA